MKKRFGRSFVLMGIFALWRALGCLPDAVRGALKAPEIAQTSPLVKVKIMKNTHR